MCKGGLTRESFGRQGWGLFCASCASSSAVGRRNRHRLASRLLLYGGRAQRRACQRLGLDLARGRAALLAVLASKETKLLLDGGHRTADGARVPVALLVLIVSLLGAVIIRVVAFVLAGIVLAMPSSTVSLFLLLPGSAIAYRLPVGIAPVDVEHPGSIVTRLLLGVTMRQKLAHLCVWMSGGVWWLVGHTLPMDSRPDR